MKIWEIPANDLGEEIASLLDEYADIRDGDLLASELRKLIEKPPREQRGKEPVLVHPEGWRSDGQMVDQGRKI